MKRWVKNLIVIIATIAVIGSIVFTSYAAKKNLVNTSKPSVMANDGNEAPGENSSDSNTSTDNASNDGQTSQANTDGDSSNTSTDTQTPPEKPDGDSSNSTDDTQTPPEKPDGDSSNTSTDTQTPPEKPDGDSSNSTDDTQTPPEKPDGDNTNSSSDTQTPSEMPSGVQPDNGNQNGDMSAWVATDATLTVKYYVLFGLEALLLGLLVMYMILSRMNKKTFKETFEAKNEILIYALATVLIAIMVTVAVVVVNNNYVLKSNKTQTDQQMPGGGETTSAKGATEITEAKTVTSGTYESSTSDENAILVNGSFEAKLSGITVNKTGDSDGGDNTSFYGTNSAILATGGANLTLEDITVNTDATGANGVFCYGGSATTNNTASDGTSVNISDSTITTTKDNSGGIMTTGGGIMNATNLKVTTAGTSSAAIRTDRGGGTVTVNKGTYKTTGKGSPAIYSTADVTVKNAKLIATASEGVVIEGKNSVTLNKVTLTDSNTELNGQSTTYKNIFIYQSMSGDASEGSGTFSATDSKITTKNGDTFYVTNTSAIINLENNTITNKDSDGNFLRAEAGAWGNEGSNGGDVTLNMTSQDVTGNIVIDKISTLVMNMTKSTYKGTINGDNTAKSIKLVLDKNSKITLTGDSYVTSLEDADSDYSNINFNGYKLYVNGKAIN